VSTPATVTLTLFAHDVRFLVWHVLSSTTHPCAIRIAGELRAQADAQAARSGC